MVLFMQAQTNKKFDNNYPHFYIRQNITPFSI
jgi:hypothetical protein